MSRPVGAPPPDAPPPAERRPPSAGPRQGPRTLAMTNLTGHPAVVVPCGFRQGLPVGLQFVANLFDEAAAIRLAHAYEQATDWHKRRPPL